MAERFKFTQRRVQEIAIPEPRDGKQARKEYHDLEQPRLVLRVSSTGTKSFAVLKKDQAGKSRRITIGQFPEITVSDARTKAGKILADIHSGIDPMEQKRVQRARSLSLKQLFELYIQNHDLKPVTIMDYRKKMLWGFSDWLHQPASKIGEDMVLSRHNKLTSQGKTTTNGAFRTLRAVLNYAKATGAIESNPVSILSAARLWHKNNRKNNLIQSHQLKEWIEAVHELEIEAHRVAYLIMLYMGFRIMETYSLEWKDVDLNNELIIQRDTKNGTDHELPIPSVIVPIIAHLKQNTEQCLEKGEKMPAHLFFSPKNPATHYTMPRKPTDRINDRISFTFNPHMTRHTFTTIAEAVGIPKTMIDRLTNHTNTNDVTGGYIHTETETLREAINKIAAYIQAKITSEEKVVKLYG